MYFPFLNSERFRAPESSKSQGSPIFSTENKIRLELFARAFGVTHSSFEGFVALKQILATFEQKEC